MFHYKKRAANGARTRDLDLGKVALYQLSYCRTQKKNETSEEEETRTPTTIKSLPPQSSASTNSATPPTCKQPQINTVPRTGLEPARRETHAPETCASTNSATWAFGLPTKAYSEYERQTGLEPATSTLARSRSTN